MNKHSRTVSGIKVLMVCMLLLSMMTLSAGVSSMRSRAVTRADVELTPNARITMATLLANTMISIGVSTDGADENNFLLVEFEITIDTEDDDWNNVDNPMKVSFVRSFGKNVNVTFTNTSIFQDFQNNNLDLDDFGSFAFSGEYPKIEGDIANFLTSGTVPEGEYTMEITLTELDPGGTGSVKVGGKSASKGMNFYVVRIGNMSITQTPTITDPVIRWTLPEVPTYRTYTASSFGTKSVIRITGTDVNYSRTITHGRASPQDAVKGFPGGTDRGAVELALPANLLGIPGARFRMGETYTLHIEFRDWNNALIDDRQRTFTFSPDFLDLFTPTGAIDDIRPVFEWGFDVYAPWVDYYTLYINGVQAASNIAGTTYELPYDLSYGSGYTWYVMPFYGDRKPFFASPPTAVSFSAPEHLPPEVEIASPQAGDQLLVGETYTFSADVSAYEGSSIESVTWTIGSSVLTGETVQYTPNARFPNNSLRVDLSVTDSRGGRTSKSTAVTVRNPAAAMEGGNRSTAANQELSFSINRGASVDFDEVFWNVYAPDGSVQQESGEELSYQFSSLGVFQVEIGVRTADSFGGEREVLGSRVNVTVTSAGAPQVAFSGPEGMSAVRINQDIPVTVSVTSPNEITSTTWRVGSTVYEFAGLQEEFTFTPTQELLGSASGRTVTITCEVTDEFGDRASASRNLAVINPILTVANLTSGQRWSIETPVQASLTAEYARSVSWAINGDTKSAPYLFPAPGPYDFRAEAQWDVVGSDGSLEVFEQSLEFSLVVIDSRPPAVSITSPILPSGQRLITGVPYEFTGLAVSDSDIAQMWWTIGSSGRLDAEDGAVEYEFEPGSGSRVVTARFFAENTDGVVGQTSVSLQVIDPTVTVSWPAADLFAAASRISVQAAASHGQLLWSIEGETALGASVSQQLPDSQWNKMFMQPGTYTLQPGFSVQALGSSGAGETHERFTNDSFTLRVFSSDPPRITSALPLREVLRQQVGEALNFFLESESPNTLRDTSWTVRSGSAVLTEGSGSTFSYAWASPGVYVVEARTSDEMGLSALRQWSVRIIEPQVVITYPEEGGTYGDRSFSAPEIILRDSAAVQFFLNGSAEPVPPGFSWESLPSGSYTIQASSSYQIIPADGDAVQRHVLSDVRSFTLTALAPPEIKISGLDANDRLISGMTYELSAEAAGADGAEIVSITWTADAAVFGSGEQVLFDAGSQRGRRSIRVTAQDEFGLSSSVTLPVQVLDPSVSIVLPEISGMRGVYPADTIVTLQHISQDVDGVTWVLGGAPYASSRFRFIPGTYSMSALGAVTARLQDGTVGEYTVESDTVERIQVLGLPRVNLPAAVPQMSYQGASVMLQTSIEGDIASLRMVEWLLNGNVIAEVRSPQSLEFSWEVPNAPAGSNRAALRVTDIFGRVSRSDEEVFRVIRPIGVLIDIPTDGAVFGPAEQITLRSRLADERNREFVQQVFWSVNGAPQSSTDFFSGQLGTLEAGEHTLSFSAVDVLGTAVSADVQVSVQSDLIISLLNPREDLSILEGSSLTARVSARTLSPRVDVTTLIDDIIWYVNGQEAARGTSFLFSGFGPGSYELQARYEQGEVSRQTRAVTITVDPLVPPVIAFPSSERLNYYSTGEALQLRAEGYADAAYRWILDGNVIGRGQRSSFFPEGLSGPQRLELEMEYQGITQRTSSTVSLEVNTPPRLTLEVPEVQFSGSSFVYTAAAIDLEDGVLQPSLMLNGVELEPGREIVFTADDIGVHEFRGSVTDSMGVRTAGRRVFTVMRGVDGVEILSPRAEESYIIGRPVNLASRIIGGAVEGDYTWRIQYLDGENSSSSFQLEGNRVSFVPEHTGALRVTAVFSSQFGRVTEERVIQVIPEPAVLSIYWPHGSVVNAGTRLESEAAGLTTEQLQRGTVEWFLNGQRVQFGNITAPLVGGEHTLSVRYLVDGRTAASDQVSFTVNERPRVTITSPADQAVVEINTPALFSARVEDDQVFAGTFQWLLGDEALASSREFAVQQLSPGRHTIRAIALDQFGARNTGDNTEGLDRVEILVIEPIRLQSVTVNNGVLTYLLTAGEPIPAEAVISGGADPVVRWILQQGDIQIETEGASVMLPAEQQGFSKGPARLRVSVIDRGEQRVSRDISLNFVEDAQLSMISPEAGEPIWTASSLSVKVSAPGFSVPGFSASIQGEAAEVTVVSGGQGVFDLLVDCSACSSEGVYELVLEASENGLVRSAGYTMNVFSRETGIFITAPDQIDLRDAAAPVITAEVHGIVPAEILWFTGVSAASVGSGTQFVLNASEVSPGLQVIEVQAVDTDGTVIASDSASVMMLGEISLTLDPSDESVTFQQGSPAGITAAAFDRDASLLTGERITWRSHRGGVLGNGEAIQPGLMGIDSGEHIFTVEASGMGGETRSRIVTVLLRGEHSPPPSEESEQQEEETPPEIRRTFSQGRGVPFQEDVRTVSTVASVSGTVTVVRAAGGGRVTLETVLNSSDVVQVNRNAQLVLINTITNEVNELGVQGRYAWDDGSSSWIME